MKKETISGIGSFSGNNVDILIVEGIGKLRRASNSNTFTVEGIFKSKGTITTNELNIQGIARIFRNITARNVNIVGILKLRRAKLKSDNIRCNGIIVSNREVNADNISLDGVCSIRNLYGDKISIQNKENGLQESKVPTKFMPFVKMYFGRKLSLTHSLVDIVECTSLYASGLESKIIRANEVELKDNCIIGKLYCDGEISIDDSCEIGELNGKDYVNKNKKEDKNVANISLVKILDLYKDGKINEDEAENMIGALSKSNTGSDLPKVSWEDDKKLRIVAYIGRKLLKKGDPDEKTIEITYDGEALNVECYGNLTCNDIKNNASAGRGIHSANIGGNVSCGRDLTCESVGGNIAAGRGVHINK